MKCLPHTSFSTAALALLCVRWSSWSKPRGSFGEAEAVGRLRARILFEALTLGASTAPSMTFLLEPFRLPWTMRYPRPPLTESSPDVVAITATLGSLNLKLRLDAGNAAKPGSVLRKLQQVVGQLVPRDHNDIADIKVLFSALAQKEQALPLLAQMLATVALSLDAHFAQLAMSAEQPDTGCWKFRWTSLQDVDAGSREMERILVTCTERTRAIMSHFHIHGLPTDGAIVAGLKL